MLAKISAIGGTLLVAVVILAVVFTGCTKIDQTEYCIETRFGKVVDEHMATGMALTVFSEATCFPLTDVNFPATGQTCATLDPALAIAVLSRLSGRVFLASASPVLPDGQLTSTAALGLFVPTGGK